MTPHSLDDAPEAPPAALALTAKLPPHWALGPAHLAIVTLATFVFILYCNLPLRSTDLWGHTMCGAWILGHRTLPTEDPFFPLAAGMRFLDFSWLAQIIFAAIDRSAGPVGLAILFAMLVLATGCVLARTFYLQSRSLWIMLTAVVCTFGVAWSRMWTLRPEMFGMLGFALIILLLTRSDLAALAASTTDADLSSTKRAQKTDWLLWLGAPAIFALWVNLHASFLCGLLLIGLWTIGTFIDTAWQQRSVVAALGNANVQRLAFLTELSFLATLINPFGLEVHINSLRFAANQNLQFIVEWLPLTILGSAGIEFAFSCVALLFLWRHSKAPITCKQLLLLLVFALLSIQRIRMIGWYAFVFGWAIVPHLCDLATRWFPSPSAAPTLTEGSQSGIPRGRSFHYTLACGLVIWLGFVFSPLGGLVLEGKGRPEERQYEKGSSPYQLTEYLRQHPPTGQVYHPQRWGDWFIRRVPGFRPFVTTNIHLAPRQLWDDYMHLSFANSGWQAIADRYNVTTIIMDKEYQQQMLAEVKRAPGWEMLYEDEQGAVYGRRAQAKKATSKDESPVPGTAPSAGVEKTANDKESTP